MPSCGDERPCQNRARVPARVRGELRGLSLMVEGRVGFVKPSKWTPVSSASRLFSCWGVVLSFCFRRRCIHVCCEVFSWLIKGDAGMNQGGMPYNLAAQMQYATLSKIYVGLLGERITLLCSGLPSYPAHCNPAQLHTPALQTHKEPRPSRAECKWATRLKMYCNPIGIVRPTTEASAVNSKDAELAWFEPFGEFLGLLSIYIYICVNFLMFWGNEYLTSIKENIALFSILYTQITSDEAASAENWLFVCRSHASQRAGAGSLPPLPKGLCAHIYRV